MKKKRSEKQKAEKETNQSPPVKIPTTASTRTHMLTTPQPQLKSYTK